MIIINDNIELFSIIYSILIRFLSYISITILKQFNDKNIPKEYSIYNKKLFIFNYLPTELNEYIKSYVGITSRDIHLVYTRLISKKIKWTIYEKPTSNIYKLVKIIPHLFKKGKYIDEYRSHRNSNLDEELNFDSKLDIAYSRFKDYDTNPYDFEYFYRYTIKCLNPHMHYVPYPIRGIYISRIDLMISFLLLDYKLDYHAYNYNINCICTINYQDDIEKLNYFHKMYNNL
jgi:hypothetical protein